MEVFLQNIFSFPTIIFTVLLIMSVIFWFFTILGLSDIDFLEMDFDFDGLDGVDGLDLEGGSSSESSSTFMEFIGGLLMRLGLVGVPITVSLTILGLIGWLISYYIVLFFLPFEAGTIMRYLVGLPVFFATLFVSGKITSFLIRPLRKLFANVEQVTEKIIIGQTAVVRTSRVDANFGEAMLNDGGAGLIIKIRTSNGETFAKGDRVVIFEKLSPDNVYRVISEEDFAMR